MMFSPTDFILLVIIILAFSGGYMLLSPLLLVLILVVLLVGTGPWVPYAHVLHMGSAPTVLVGLLIVLAVYLLISQRGWRGW
jgi:hypothetical protein